MDHQEDRILICGCGISGQGAALLAAHLGKKVIFADEKSSMTMNSYFADFHREHPESEAFFNWNEQFQLPVCSAAVLSPGIRENSKLFQYLRRTMDDSAILSELDFALRHITVPFCSITGTNGKTTTTELTCALFNANNLPAECAGNIGESLSGRIVSAAKGTSRTLVIETSSFQLETMKDFPACPAAVLNLASDHIDRHGSMELYAQTKFKILAGAPSPEGAIINANLMEWKERFLPGKKITTFSAEQEADFTFDGKQILFHGKAVFETARSPMKGIHNVENMMAALALLRAFAGDEALFSPGTARTLENFHSGEHRMELFAEQDGIRYYDDSKATNPHAVNAAVRALADGKNILLLLGGLDKDMDFQELAVSFPFIKHAFLTGQCREKIYSALKEKVPCTLCCSFEAAARSACAEAVSGDCVMLSPATASMDMFRNYAERGDRFKEIVRSVLLLKKSNQA